MIYQTAWKENGKFYLDSVGVLPEYRGRDIASS
jgi:ribosomal protein S18 acetylase RimI-like enzyme